MNRSDIARYRLQHQQIAAGALQTVAETAAWMCAMQAQDYSMVKWAFGARLPGLTEKEIAASINAGEVIRTHLLRPTWHIVAAADVCWMLELTAPHILSSSNSRHKDLELTPALVSKTRNIIEKALSDHPFQTRQDLVSRFEQAGIDLGDNRAAHILMLAELDGLICSGPDSGNKQTYALLADRVAKPRKLHREEALVELARRYFTSHQPATLDDFIWWSGLPVRDARKAMEGIKPDFVPEEVEGQTYWISQSFSVPPAPDPGVFLLPAFDEFIISYRDRTAALTFEDHTKAVSNNGIFRPTIVVDGQVTGIWKRAVKKNKVEMEGLFFRSHTKTEREEIKAAAAGFGRFLEKEAVIDFKAI